MKEVLSQAEIDMLLSALSTGQLPLEEAQPAQEQLKVKPYDFRRPNKFSQDHLRTLSLIHENFARMASNFLSGYLRTGIQIKVASVDQLTYEDFIISIPSPTLMTVFTMSPLPGRAVLETNAAFIFPIVDLLFGGSGEMPRKVRELTDIEINVLRHLNMRILENMSFAWSDIYEVVTRIEGMETNPQLSQVVSPNETVAVITFSSQVGKHSGLINLCLPFITLEPVISRLSTRHWFASGEVGDAAQYRKRLEDSLKAVPLELMVLGGETTLTVRDILHLEVGDVITLDNRVEEDLTLLVAGRPKFKGQPGIVENKLAVQITGLSGEGLDKR